MIDILPLVSNMQHDSPAPMPHLAERVCLGRLVEREGAPDHGPGVTCVDHLRNRPQVRAGREGRVFDRANAALLGQIFRLCSFGCSLPQPQWC